MRWKLAKKKINGKTNNMCKQPGRWQQQWCWTEKNENIYYFIRVWHAAVNKLWHNLTGEIEKAKYHCSHLPLNKMDRSFFSVLLKEMIPITTIEQTQKNTTKNHTSLKSTSNLTLKSSHKSWTVIETPIEYETRKRREKKTIGNYGKQSNSPFPYWF